MFQIEARDEKSRMWDVGLVGVGAGNEYATREEAEEMIPQLRTLGDDWLDAEYRVVEIKGVEV